MLPFFGVKERLVLFQRDVRGSACRLYPLIPFLLIGVRLTSFPLFYKSSSPVLSVTSPLARTTTARGSKERAKGRGKGTDRPINCISFGDLFPRMPMAQAPGEIPQAVKI